jgi:hypothetical protein
MCFAASAPAAPAALRIIASNGTAVASARLTTIRSGVSINNRRTVACAGFLSDGRGALLAMTPDGQLKEPRPGGGLVSGYGVQIKGEVAFSGLKPLGLAAISTREAIHTVDQAALPAGDTSSDAHGSIC